MCIIHKWGQMYELYKKSFPFIPIWRVAIEDGLVLVEANLIKLRIPQLFSVINALI